MAVASYMNSPKVKKSPTPANMDQARYGNGGVRPSQGAMGSRSPYAPPVTPGINANASTVGRPGAKMPPIIPAPRPQQPPSPHTPIMPPPVSTQPVRPGGTPSGGWNLPSWNPTQPQYAQPAPGTPAPRSGSQAFWDSVGPWKTDFDDPEAVNRINTLLPVAQYDQNAMQYQQDFNEAMRRWNAEYDITQNQNAYQQGLSTRQQQAAEEQARIAAAQWGQQFGHTQNMDLQGLDLSRTQIGNELRARMDQNQATRDVANIYGQSNQYQANQQLAGTKYASDQDRIAAMYGADQGLRQAGMYSGAQRYQADMGLREAMGYADAQRYGAQLGLQGQQYQADRGLQEAQGYADAQRFGAQLGLQGQQYQADRGFQEAGLYSGAQRYGADTQFAGTRYESDVQRQIAAEQNAFLLQQLQQQSQQAELERQARLREANLFAFGRSEAPQGATWARNWG